MTKEKSYLTGSDSLLKNLMVTNIVKKYHAFYGTGIFIVVFLFCTRLILFLCLRPVLILLFHLCLRLQSDLFLSSFLSIVSNTFIFSPVRAIYADHLPFLH
jgi:hypothetical protein